MTAVENNDFLFSLSTIHWLPTGYLGEEPAPTPSAPRIVVDFLRSKMFVARSGSEQLFHAPITLHDGHSELFVRHLEDPHRECPIVLLAVDFENNRALVDPAQLARLLAGAAKVFVSESSWMDKELEKRLGRSFSCWNGMIRVYQPRVDLASIVDARRHRFFTKVDIQANGADKIKEMLVRAIVRRSRSVFAQAVTTIEDVQSKQAEQRFKDELQKVKEGSQEWTQLLNEEIDRLNSVLRKKEDEIAGLSEQLDKAEEVKDEIARIQYELQAATARALEAESIRSALAAKAAILINLDRLPSTIPDVVDLIEKVWPDKIVFTQKARESAAKSTLRNPSIAWKCLRMMATVLHDLHFADRANLREIAVQFREKTGFELAVAESETTKTNKRLASQRKDVYKGQSIDISLHVKYGASANNNLRIHYYAHGNERKLIVGHCGDHLDTVRTN